LYIEDEADIEARLSRKTQLKALIKQYEETDTFLRRQEAANAQSQTASPGLKAWIKAIKLSKRLERSIRANWATMNGMRCTGP
jgi:hypothetical protein